MEPVEKLAEDFNKDLSAYKEDIKSDVASIKEDVSEQTNSIKYLSEKHEVVLESIKKQGQEITELREQTTVSKKVDMYSDIEKQLSESELVKKVRRGEQVNSSIVAKVAGTMLNSTNVTGDIPLPSIEAGIERVVRRQPFVLQLTNGGGTIRIESNQWGFNEQKNPDGGAGMTAEGTLKSQSDFDLVQTILPVRKVSNYIKVSTEMLDDIPLLMSEIRQELVENVTLLIDSQILNGDGTGQNLTGILTNATAFSVAGTDFALGVINPNNQDVLEAAITQIRSAEFEPNYILMNPVDVGYMKVGKDTVGAYEINPIVRDNNMIIDGVPVIANTGITAGDFLVGDFSKSAVAFKKELSIQMGHENDDFTNNLITILAESRLVHRVKTNHFPAFVTGNFAAAKILITKP